MSKISITVEFTEAEFKRMVKDADMRITDKDKFKEILTSKAFADALAEDLKQCWESLNEESGDMDCVLEGLGLEECIEEVEFE